MSHYTTTELVVNDVNSFVDAIVECWESARGHKITREDVEVLDEPDHLYGFQNDRRDQKANVIIRRDKVGNASNDIGFMIKDGKATAFISEFDSSKYSQKWQGKVKQRYSINVTKKAAIKKGWKIEESWVDGKCKLITSKYVTV